MTRFLQISLSISLGPIIRTSWRDLEICFHPYWLLSKRTSTSIWVNKKWSPIVTSPPASLLSDRM